MELLKNRRVTLALLFSAAALLVSCTTPPGNADDGKKWYGMYNCLKCHGENGKNGRAAAIAALSMGYGHFERILRDPYSPSMPRFPESKVSKQDAADISAWLKSMPE
jgi:mono/diheme cytochrome c family protein